MGPPARAPCRLDLCPPRVSQAPSASHPILPGPAVSCQLTLREEEWSARPGQSYWISRAQPWTRDLSGSRGLWGRGQSRSGLLSLDLVDISSWIILVVWGCPVCGQVSRGFPGLHPICDNRHVSPGGHSPPSFRAAAVSLLTLISFLLPATFADPVRPLQNRTASSCGLGWSPGQRVLI